MEGKGGGYGLQKDRGFYRAASEGNGRDPGAAGITGGAVSKWERGLCYPDIELVAKLSEEFSVSTNEILAGERLEELTWETADAIMRETVQTYGREMKRKLSRKAVFVAIGVLLAAWQSYGGYG